MLFEKKNDAKYFCQSCAGKIVLRYPNKIVLFYNNKTSESLRNSENNGDAPDNIIITPNSNKN